MYNHNFRPYINKKNNIMENKILDNTSDNDRYTMAISKKEHDMLSEKYDELYKKNVEMNNLFKIKKEKKRFYNLSLSDIIKNLSLVLIHIINESVEYLDEMKRNELKFDIDRIINIFTKDGRLIYVGIFLIMLSMFLYFITISS